MKLGTWVNRSYRNENRAHSNPTARALAEALAAAKQQEDEE